MICKMCDLPMTYHGSREKNDQIYHFFHCAPCSRCDHKISYKYHPTACPKHAWEHMGCEFVDDKNCHQVNHVRRCFRCGKELRIPMDTRSVGINNRIEIDNPKVWNQLLFNQSSWERKVPKELRELSVGTLPKHAVLPSEENT